MFKKRNFNKKANTLDLASEDMRASDGDDSAEHETATAETSSVVHKKQKT
jgi:hypothetical protein